MSETRQTHRIVILGGGFGGVYTARRLEKLLRRERGRVEITLVSRDNYFLMTPLLFEAGSGVLDPRHSVTAIRRMLGRTRFVEAEVERVDFERKLVIGRHAPTTGHIEIPYDQLVIGVGGVTNTNIIPGSEHATTFKTLADAIYLRNAVIDTFEAADAESAPDVDGGLLTFVVIGAGLVGVELMGELTSFLGYIQRSYPRARERGVRFHLIEAGPRILPEMDESLARHALRVLERRGVRVHINSPVKQILRDRVILPDGSEILSRTIVLAAGVATNPLLAEFPVDKDRKGRIAVEPTMRSRSHPEVWAIGDCASIPDPTGKPYPQLAQHALREAKVLAHNLTVVVRGAAGQADTAPMRPFVYENMGTLAALGHFDGVGRVMMFKVRGFLAWWVWRTYYLSQMPRFERKLRIVLDWTVALFFHYDIVKLDLFGEAHPTHGRREFHRGAGQKTDAAREPAFGGQPGHASDGGASADGSRQDVATSPT